MSSFFRNLDAKTGRPMEPINHLSDPSLSSTFMKQHKLSDLRARVRYLFFFFFFFLKKYIYL